MIFKNGDRNKIKNYRPISLTNTDYKLLAFVLALQLQKVMPSVINNDQTGYIKNRFIGFSIRTIQDLIEYCNNFDKKGVLLFLYFKKAFDRIEWKFLQKLLRGSTLIQFSKNGLVFYVQNQRQLYKTMVGYLKVLKCPEVFDKEALPR